MEFPDVSSACLSITNLLRGESGYYIRMSSFFFSFYFLIFFLFFYLLGGSASPPLASRRYLWPPCWFSPKQIHKTNRPRSHYVTLWQGLWFEKKITFSLSFFFLFFASFTYHEAVVRKRSISRVVAASLQIEKKKSRVTRVLLDLTRDCVSFCVHACFVLCKRSASQQTIEN